MELPDFERAQYVTPYAADREETVPEPTAILDKLAFSRAIAYGLFAAVLGAVIYGVVGLWIQIGFVSILVGAMVGNAMMNGSGGIGGRRYQIVAVTLTYFAVSLASVFDGLWSESHRQGDLGSYVTHHVVLLLFMVLVGPVIEVFVSFGSGAIGLLILFFGMQSAWKVARGGPGYIHFKRYDPHRPLNLRD